MKLKKQSVSAAFVLLAASLLSAPSIRADDASGGRYALVIGNSAYSGEVVSGVEDATNMADYLKQAGFTNTTLLRNRKLKDMESDLKTFGASIKDASVVVFFYSGHGFQVGGQNFLRPTDGDFAPDEAVSLTQVTDALANASKAVKVVFLDACRDIRNLPPDVLKGLAEMKAPEKTVVAFAAAPGQLAASGNAGTDQKLSPYTEALLRYIREPGLDLLEFLARVHHDVAIRGTGQSPTEFGLSHLGGKPFYLRNPVYVKARIEDVDDSMIVFQDNDIVLQGSQGEGPEEATLRLKARDNVLKLFVSNEKTFRRSQSWERPEGWKYQFQIYPANGQPLLCSEHTVADGCFSARERVPFKAGRRHGKVFQVAQVNLHVDPVTAELTIHRDDTLWAKDTPEHEKNQDVLFKRKLFELPLSRILTDQWAAIAVWLLGLVAPEPDKIFVTARGNAEAKEEVEACMADEDPWIERLQASISLAMQHDPKPFQPFDDALTECVHSRDPSLGETGKNILVYTAVEDHHGEAPEESLAMRAGAGAGPRVRLPAFEGLDDETPAERELRERLAQMFSPVRPEQHQLAAVRASEAQLAKLDGRPLLYASVSAADLQAHLPASLEARFQERDVEGRAQVARIELRDQQIVVWTAFEIIRPAANLTLWGEAEIQVAAAVERGALILRPSAETVHFTKTRLGRDEGRDVPFTLAGILVQAFLNNVKQALAIQRIPLRVGGLQVLDLADLLNRMGGVIQANAQPAGLNVGLGTAALLVDADGVHVLADAVVLTPERFAETVEQLRQHVERDEKSPFTSAQLAVLGECGQLLPLPEQLSQTFASVCAALAGAVLTEDPLPTETPEEAEAALRQELPSFQQRFRDKAESVEPGLPSKRTLVALSRSQAAVGLNEILPGVVVQATLRPDGFRGEIPDDQRRIRTPKAPDLRCDQAGEECSGFGLARLFCEGRRIAQQAGCRANQGWLELVDDQEVGELQGHFEVRNANLPLMLDQVRLGNDFESIDLRLTAEGRGEVFGQLSARPLNLGHLVCLAPWETSATAQVNLPRQQRSMQLRHTGSGLTPDEELRVTYELAETPLQLQIQPAPVQAFLEQNAAKLALSCPVPAFVVGQLAGFSGVGFPLALSLRNEILRDTFPVTLPAQEIPVVIPSQTIPVGEGEPIRLVPSWGERAILFEAR